jgi:hypothetical protein
MCRQNKGILTMTNGKPYVFTNQQMKIVDDPDAKEIFADELAGISHTNGICTLTFTKVMADPSQNPAVNYKKVSGRLRITLPGMFGMKMSLGNILEQLEQLGLMVTPSQPPPPTHPLQ